MPTISPDSLYNPANFYRNSLFSASQQAQEPSKPLSPSSPSSSGGRLSKVRAGEEGGKPLEVKPKECQTCENRKYQDQSSDPGVSFKRPMRISPGRAARAVRAHENEHVYRERARAA